MFGFLKNKLKEWVDKAKDSIKPAAPSEAKASEPTQEPSEAKASEPTDEEKEKLDETKREIKKAKPKKEEKQAEQEPEKADKIIEEAKKEKIEEAPLEFNVALQKYEPDIEKIKEKTKEAKASEPTKEIPKSEPLTQKSFLKKLFGKKEAALSKSKDFELTPALSKSKDFELTPEPKEEEPTQALSEAKASEPAVQKSFFKKLKSTFAYKISEDDFNNLFEDLEMLLLENNVALEVVEDLKTSLSKKLIGKEIKKDALENEIKTSLKEALNELIINPEDPLIKIKSKKQSKEPFVILFFGINGTGKTTSIAKLTYLLKEKGFSVVLAAADTFRAASIEQISEHASKLKVPLIKHDYQGDPAAVGFDAIKYAENHRIDVVLIDTAGRMHTKTNLLAEMEKIVRVTQPDLKIFVAESIAGNDATEQAKTFNEMIGIDGTILSKADVDEKGGTIISVSHATKKPIFYLGTGQTYKDLKLFNKNEYIESLGL